VNCSYLVIGSTCRSLVSIAMLSTGESGMDCEEILLTKHWSEGDSATSHSNFVGDLVQASGPP